MINELRERFSKSSKLLEDFVETKCGGILSVSAIIYFLDSHKLFIGITSSDDGTDFIVEINGIMINVKSSRILAEGFAINEGFSILEKII